MAIATFAAGCFWGIEEAFDRLDGVEATCVGYSGGHSEAPNYEEVCSGQTGHAEVVRVNYDPSLISYGELLNLFWKIHDPTSLNRQGADIGTQYRSAIYYHTEEQGAAALSSLADLQSSETLGRDIVTEVKEASVFHPAEDYHQKFFAKRKSSLGHRIRN